MIGTVTFQWAGQEFVATLEDNERWTVDEPILEDYFNARFPVEEVSEADGVRGSRQLRDAARALSGQVQLVERQGGYYAQS